MGISMNIVNKLPIIVQLQLQEEVFLSVDDSIIYDLEMGFDFRTVDLIEKGVETLLVFTLV